MAKRPSSDGGVPYSGEPGDGMDDMERFEEPDLGSASSESDHPQDLGDGFAGGDEEAGTGEGLHEPTPSSLQACMDAIAQRLQSQAAQGIQSLGDEETNIQGASVCTEPIDGQQILPGEPYLAVYTAEPTDDEQVRRTLADTFGVQAASDDSAPIVAVNTGIIEAQPHRFRLRPAPSGISCGHHRITAGTLGCLVYQGNKLYILSNNHVLANSNAGPINAPILQPGPYDGGRNPADCIALLKKWITISFSGGTNYVDAAIAQVSPKAVRRELVYVSGGTKKFFRVGRTPADPRSGMVVGKSGRTTQLTCGRVTSTNSVIKVNFGGGRVATFADQIAIKSVNSNPFSAGGDSGSLIWTWDKHRRPVGLLFAGGGGITFANKIKRVLPALGVQLYT